MTSRPPSSSRPALRSALAAADEIFARLDGRSPAIFLDYDGTLTPIVNRPEQAHLPDATRDTLRRLAGRVPVAVVTGRDLDVVRDFVELDSLCYAGSHGFDLVGPDGSRRQSDAALALLPDLDAAEAALREQLDPIAGAEVERKRFAIAAHYRNVDESEVARFESIVDAVADDYSSLEKTGGKKIFELRPAIDWDKGHAVLWLLDALDLSGETVAPIYIGDDLTDEDAFRALPAQGVSILVGHPEHESAAAWRLADADEVREFLDRLVAWLDERD
ncbi:MAG: trehalose-phosphatase [Phycisphaerales bacterium]